MSNDAADVKGELELTAEDLEWIAKYGDDPEFQGDTEVDMADEAHPEDENAEKEATVEAEAEALAKQQAADEEARLLAEREAEEAAKLAAQSQEIDEEAEQKIYADLLSLNDKQEELSETLKASSDSLKSKESELTEIAKKFDSGDLGQGEYDIAKARLADEISGLKEQVKSLSAEEKETKKQLQEAAAKVDDLAKITKQREESAKAIEEQTQNEWDADCDAFMAQAENKVFASNADLQEELAGFVTMISQRAINKGLKISNTDLLSQARKAVAALHDDIPVATTPAKPVTPPKKELPRTLGGMSAASNPSMVIKDEFEDLENMSPAERDAALLAMPREQMKRWASGAKHA